LLLLVFLLPLAVYFLVLAHVNRRPRALVVSGPWDFAGLLFAASGFLLFGGPALLSSLSLNEAWRRFWLLAKDWPAFTQADLLLTVRVVLFVLYFVFIAGGAALVLWRRRRMTAIYNVDPVVVETVLGQVLESRQLSFVQHGNVLTFEPEITAVPPPAPATVPLVERTTRLTVDVAPALCHVTLSWSPSDSPLRREVEGQLERVLAETPAPLSGVGEWMLLIAYGLFFLILFGLTVLTLLWLFQR
jgi:hypothetical protein